MKAMVMGLSPEYNYPGNMKSWSRNNTYYASNHGASLICRSILKQFNADYINDFSDLSSLNKKYDTCFLALATHIHKTRNVSFYADIAEKLEMKIIALSLGLQDYLEAPSSLSDLHPSVIKLLNIVKDRSKLIGVRGHYTASILYRLGYKNVVPIGCPSVYWNMNQDLKIKKTTSFSKPLIVYHRSLAHHFSKLLNNIDILGQDYEDELIFTNNLMNDDTLKKIIYTYYEKTGDRSEMYKIIENKGIFHKNFNDWLDTIKTHDFILGPRLHGCIAALIHGIPAVLIPRDVRIKEISEFYSIPTINFEQLITENLSDIYSKTDYTDFNRRYKLRYRNYIEFLNENELDHSMTYNNEIENNMSFLYQDVKSICNIWNSYTKEIESNKGYIVYSEIHKLYNKINNFIKKYKNIINRKIFGL